MEKKQIVFWQDSTTKELKRGTFKYYNSYYTFLTRDDNGEEMKIGNEYAMIYDEDDIPSTKEEILDDLDDLLYTEYLNELGDSEY